MFFRFQRKIQNNPPLFVSIGAGINQLPLILEAKKLGFNIIGVDKNPMADGAVKCDIVIHESIVNYEDIFNKLLEILPYGEIAGVLSKSYGSAIKSTCFIANKFNIPMIDYSKIDNFINKKRMKSLFSRNNILSPSFISLEKSKEFKRNLDFNYPFVIKPVTGHAKINVRLVKSEKDLKKILTNKEFNNGDYLAEEYIRGDEIIAAGIIYKGQFYLISLSDKRISEEPYFVDLMHVAPSAYSHLWSQITEIGQDVAQTFEIQTSPLIMELMVKDENIYLIEAVPEFGGEYIPDLLIPASTGYNFIRETIKAVTGNGFIPPPKNRNRQTVVIKYLTGRKGTLTSFRPITPNKKSGLLYSKIFFNMGTMIKNLATNHDRIGVVITKGRSKKTALETADRTIEDLNIVIE